MAISIDPLDWILRIWKALRPRQPTIAATARNEFWGGASEWFVFPADKLPHLALFDGAGYAGDLSQKADALYISPCWMTGYIHNISELATQNILVRDVYLEIRDFTPLRPDDSFILVIHWAPAAGPYVAGPVWDVDLSDPSPRAIPLTRESATFFEPESSFRNFLVGEIKDCGIRMLAPSPGKYDLVLRLSCVSSGRVFPVHVQGNLNIVTLVSVDRVTEVYSGGYEQQYKRLVSGDEEFGSIIRNWLEGMYTFQEYWRKRFQGPQNICSAIHLE